MRSSFIAIVMALLLAGFSFSGCAKKSVKGDMGAAGDSIASMSYEDARKIAKKSTASKIKAFGDVSGIPGVSSSDIIDVLFDFDRYSLKREAKAAIMSNSEILKEHLEAKLVIEGHCDERGTAEYNIALGERRANAVKKYLVTLGIDSSRIRVVSYGKEKPFCYGHDEGCWQKNRRAHFKISR